MPSKTEPTGLLQRMIDAESFARAHRRLREDGALRAGNLIGSSAALFAAALASRAMGCVVFVLPSVGEAQAMADDLALLAPGLTVSYFPTSEESGFLREVAGSAFGQRVACAEAVRSAGRGSLLVASISALLEPVPLPNDAGGQMRVALGDDLDRDELADRLLASGFTRVTLVEAPGQVAIRGGIVDVYDHVGVDPLRIELFGDEVESIRTFAPDTQLSRAALEEVQISLLRPEAAEAVGGAHLTELLPDSACVVVREPDEVEAAVRAHRAQVGEGDPSGEVGRRLVAEADVAVHRLPVGQTGCDFDVGSIEARGTDMAGAVETLDRLSDDGAEVTAFFGAESERARFWSAVDEEAEPIVLASLRARPITSVIGSLFSGFRWRSEKLVLVNHRELFDIAVQRRPVRRAAKVQGRAIDDFVDLEDGDYVVHVVHGIGRYLGIETVEKGGETQEFLTLEFLNEVKLYVPVAKADLVQKYIGGRGEAPRLSRLGGRSWSRRKAEVFRAVTDLAAQMLETQAIRARKEGIQYPPDTPWQHEFEAAFPFQETPDQLAAIQAICADMESPRPMDRLLCGDVGYGKTEVAMRAAFKAVMSGRQVAVLVPTTVLAEQHHQTFRARMAGYPVNIASLSRFRSRAQQEDVVLGLVEGQVDIVIGTHRLLSKDVGFKDLGLLVIDEEQRFGVAHKERLRSLRRTVDVLTLSATPIPRTLHLSLLGIRDISSLTQAPRGRQPVETKIVRFDEGLVRRAVLHELERGGQCFFVHNRVQTIDRVRRELARIVPEARVLVIHGQMREADIERNLMTFVKRGADILLATTIIESGLDIRSANTMFIDRPDMYGLADLHQLRGRVGRHRDKAYAYLLLRPDTVITGDAEKRLRAIEEFDELGSGFRIAMRDLEIRGAGNLLGHQQHGHITAVGYEMYCRLLDVAVKNLTNRTTLLPDEVDLNLDFDAFIPGTYVGDPRIKLELYRKLGRASSDEDFDGVLDEMRDRFGRPPAKVLEFVDVCRIRALAEKLSLKSVSTSEGLGLMLRPDDVDALSRRLVASGATHRVIEGKKVLLVHPDRFRDPGAALAVLRDALIPSVE